MVAIEKAARGRRVVSTDRNERDTKGYEVFVNETVTDRRRLGEIKQAATPRVRERLWSHLIKSQGLVRHQIQGYERCMDTYIPSIINDNRRIVTDCPILGRRHVLELENPVVYGPTHREADGTVHAITQQECRIRNLAHSCTIVADARHTVFDITNARDQPLSDMRGLPMCSSTLSKEVVLCQPPCMSGTKYDNVGSSPFLSGECPLDPGGGFVVNGSDKFIVSQERMRTNHPCVYPAKASDSKYGLVCEFRSLKDGGMRSTSNTLVYMSKKNDLIHIVIPFVAYQIPVSMLFALLHIRTPEQIIEMVTRYVPEADVPAVSRTLKRLLDDEMSCLGDALTLSHDDMCERVAKWGIKNENVREKRIRAMQHVLANELMPHVTVERTKEASRRKAEVVSYCIARLLAVSMGLQPCDDRDNYGYRKSVV